MICLKSWNKFNFSKKGAINLGNGKKIVLVISALIIIVYIISAIYLLISHPTDTYIISQGTVSQEDECVGYIIRDEEVKKSENYKNGIYAIASEGQRVAINEPIFRYYSDKEKQINTFHKICHQLILRKSKYDIANYRDCHKEQTSGNRICHITFYLSGIFYTNQYRNYC